MSSINGARGGIGDGAGATDPTDARKKPRLKAPIKANSEVQPDPNSLLVIGDDGISHAVKFLAAKELCQSEMTCKSLRMFAAPILNCLVDDMNKKCDRPSEGKGSRTKLLRYLAAKDLADRVRGNLNDHLSRETDVYKCIFGPNRCQGCDSFPKKTANEVFYSDGSDFEFFFLCYDEETHGSKFLGFVPMEGSRQSITGTPEDSLYSFEGELTAPNWVELQNLLSREMDGNNDAWVDEFEAVVVDTVSIIAIAIEKKSCKELLVAAMSEIVRIDIFAYNDVVSYPGLQVCCDVHLNESREDAAHAAIELSVIDNKCLLRMVFWGDEKYKGLR